MAASKYPTVKADVESLLNGLGGFLTDITDGRGAVKPSALIGPQLNKYFDAYYTLRKRFQNDTIDCALMALTKSGILAMTAGRMAGYSRYLMCNSA